MFLNRRCFVQGLVARDALAATSIRWHGTQLPYKKNGASGIRVKGIAPGETFSCRSNLRQSGTYWYHIHSADGMRAAGNDVSDTRFVTGLRFWFWQSITQD